MCVLCIGEQSLSWNTRSRGAQPRSTSRKMTDFECLLKKKIDKTRLFEDFHLFSVMKIVDGQNKMWNFVTSLKSAISISFGGRCLRGNLKL